MKSYLILALIVLAGIAPFSSRAVFADEHIFLQIARTAQHSWLFPQDTPSVFFGKPLENFAAHTHPPVGEYYLALLYAVLGRFSEVPFRLLFSLFSITAVLAFYFLAQRFTRQAFLVALLFALSPAFFVMTPTLMMDIPMLALLLAGIAFYYAHLEGRKFALLAAAACFVLAAGTGYTALVPMACLFIQMLFTGRPRRELLALLAAPLALVAWQILMRTHFGALPIGGTVGFYRSFSGTLLPNLAATFSFLGALALFPWMTLAVAPGVSRKGVAAVLALAAVPALFFHFPNPWQRLWYLGAAASGLILCLAFARAARAIIARERNRGEALFMMWVPATLIFFILVADMINARYILLSLPALYLVLLRDSTARQLTRVLIPTALLSLAVAYADFAFVNSYRDWVRQTVVPLQAQGFRVWSATESGLRFYLEQEGILTLTDSDLRPSGLDLVVQHDLFRYGLSADVATMLISLKRYPMNSGFPIRTFNSQSAAGFHDSRIGLTPFSLSLAALDQVEISEVSPFVAALPQQGIPAEEVPAWSPNGVILKQNVELREFKVRIPANSKLEYEIDGEGTAEITTDGIILRRISPGTILWRNLRIVPF